MKKTVENRYPHSATLFRFCKEALEIRYDGNVKVIDQDVGAILKYDPADCSHWKKGKKNIRALATLRSIADHLSIDERLLIDIAAGRVNLEEAVFEFRGYGAFALQGKSLEALKKEFFKNPTKWQTDSTQKPFEELFDVDRPNVVKAAEAVLAAGNFTEAPIYLPEIYKLFPNLTLIQDDGLDVVVKVEVVGSGEGATSNVRYRGPELRPFMRYILAKELYKHLCRVGLPTVARFKESPAELQEIQANIFAGLILIPGKMLRKEVETIDSSIDLVLQLSESFWTSKALMNQRLRDYMEYLN